MGPVPDPVEPQETAPGLHQVVGVPVEAEPVEDVRVDDAGPVYESGGCVEVVADGLDRVVKAPGPAGPVPGGLEIGVLPRRARAVGPRLYRLQLDEIQLGVVEPGVESHQ